MKLLVIFCMIFCAANAASSEDSYTVDGYTYFFSGPFKTDWFGANEYCNYRGMVLIDIPTFAEHQRVLGLINQLNSAIYTEKVFWTSGSDLGKEGKFVWMSSGHPYTFTNWSPSQPDNVFYPDKKESENCVELRFTDQLLWNDHICSLKNHFICRNKVINPLLLKRLPECP